MVELDKIDRRILRILQENNQYTNLELAEKAYLSPPTCLRRVRRLRNEKVIVADVALLDPARFCESLFVFLEIVLDRQSETLQLEFEHKMYRAEEVMQCYMISGHADFMVIAQVSNMTAYHRFIRKTFTGDSNVRNFRSSFAMNRTKFKTHLALYED